MMTILIIEDETPLLTSLTDTLRFEGFDVLGADNGRAGVALARQHQPDFIICDIMMPELDGYGVLEELRKEPITACIPFVFLTAKTDRDQVRLGMNLGADDYITKPFKRADILNAINSRLDKKRMLRQEYEKRFEKLRNDILQGLPQELRQPLREVVQIGETLHSKNDLSPEHVRELGKTITQHSKRLQKTIGDYLVYAWIEIVQSDPVRVAALCSMWVNTPSDAITKVAQLKATEWGRSADVTVNTVNVPTRISEHNLQKIVEEVIDNAFKFSAPGTRVEVSASQSREQYIIRVLDCGDGMTRQQVADLGAHMQFERKLYEVPHPPGFGLTIAKRLTELHAGKMTIESEIGRGTCVTIELPT